MNNGKFKTVLCKHFGQTGACSYGDKCQFAHGFQELKQNNNSAPGLIEPMVKNVPNPSNFKIVKCKNWETTNSCKYGSVCTFAHGDNEIRTKSDNNLLLSENAITIDSGIPQNYTNPYLMQDPNYIYSIMMQQEMMSMGANPIIGINSYPIMGMNGIPLLNPNQYYPMLNINQDNLNMNLNNYNNMSIHGMYSNEHNNINLNLNNMNYNGNNKS